MKKILSLLIFGFIFTLNACNWWMPSEVENNTQNNIPPIPILKSPLNSISNVSTSPTFTWYGEESDNVFLPSVYYDLQLSTKSSFSDVMDAGSIRTTSIQFKGLSYSTTYYWRVRAYNDNGTSDFSIVWSFTTTTK